MMNINTTNNQFILCSNRINEYENCLEIGDYKFQYGNTNVCFRKNYDNAVVLFGRLVDCHDPQRPDDEIAEELLRSQGIDTFLEASKKIAGRFVLLFKCKNNLFVVPDACATIHVVYTEKGNELFVSSNPKLIAEQKQWEECDRAREIKDHGMPQYSLPYTMTMYEQIQIVLPNHYLECEERKVVRYYPTREVKKISIEEAARQSSALLKNILSGYHRRYRLSLPLTSGTDSRTILACCRDIKHEIPLYTFLHKGFTMDTADIRIPKQISQKEGLHYRIIEDLSLPDSLVFEYQSMLGRSYNPAAARLAWTYKNSELSDRIYLSGEISPLGKSSFGANLPEFFATTSYLVAKTHNFSRENRRETGKWVSQVSKQSKISGISKYDLFFWEYRCGRWASNTFMNTDMLINMINLFNCREVLEIWLAIPRKERHYKGLHKKIIDNLWPELLRFEINPDNKAKQIKQCSFLYYLAVKIKFAIQKIGFILKNISAETSRQKG